MPREKKGFELTLEQQGEIKKRLQIYGVTGADIARRCGVNNTYVARVLNGRQVIPRKMQIAIYAMLYYDVVETRKQPKEQQ
jgi:transcriptional regulator with XRE-family HTH domain